MNEQAMKIAAIVIFAVTYLLLLIFSKYRSFIALVSAVLFAALGIMPLSLIGAVIDWNLLLMLLGIMGTVSLFIDSKMPAAIGDFLISKTPNLKWAVIILCLFAGFVSAFIDNVATVLIMAPIAMGIAKKTNTSPVAPVIAIAIMSNLQGAATLVGDTTSILLGAHAGLNFFDFFFFQGKAGLFWVVQLSMIAATLFLLFVFRKDKQKFPKPEKEKPKAVFPAVLLVLTVVLLIAASFIPQKYQFSLTNGIICTGLFLTGLIYSAIKTKSKKHVFDIFKGIDYLTLLLIASLFVIIGGLVNVGIIDDLASVFARASSNPFIIYTIVVFASVLMSGVVDNIPYVAAMLPVVGEISLILGINPYLLYFGLICGATLGGNLTPIGASANVAALGMLRKDGHKVSAGRFMKISVPFTLVAVSVGYALIWLLWA